MRNPCKPVSVSPYEHTRISTKWRRHGEHVVNLSIKSRLLVMLLGVSAISIAIVASLSYYASYNALRDSVFQQLTSLRAIKAQGIETYFNALDSRLQESPRGPSHNRRRTNSSRPIAS